MILTRMFLNISCLLNSAEMMINFGLLITVLNFFVIYVSARLKTLGFLLRFRIGVTNNAS